MVARSYARGRVVPEQDAAFHNCHACREDDAQRGQHENCAKQCGRIEIPISYENQLPHAGGSRKELRNDGSDKGERD